MTSAFVWGGAFFLAALWCLTLTLRLGLTLLRDMGRTGSLPNWLNRLARPGWPLGVHLRIAHEPQEWFKETWRRLGDWMRRKRIQYFRRVDRNAKCPACGHTTGDIVFSVEQRLLVHKCFVCRAEWGEKPIMIVEHWLAEPAAPSPDTGY